ncbi:hypothetical protein B0H15DRAFT_817521 [Mycena belliarum]|uniref:F-box domain-containing protein n=1 Tax=Mycena belliarum TaxID=1033014 RepID=A0AAD6UEK9_9AGAR|nr:hypothetical protein B0H15DRAFT_817521 [Mycena belliae]
MSKFPQELIDAIIDKIPYSSPSLAACALTSTAFVISSQRRLFWDISLSSIGTYQRVAEILASSPHLGAYVRWLALDIKEVPQDFLALKAIVPRMPNVERLTIAGNAWTIPNQVAENPCLLELISLPSLKALSLDDLAEITPSFILRAFSSVEQLSLSRIGFANAAEDPGDAVSNARVEHLKVCVDMDGTILSFISERTRFPHLRNLASISVLYPPICDAVKPGFNSLLTACSSTLNHLTLELEASYDNLPVLPVLSHLELWLDVELLRTPVQLAAIVSRTAAATPHIHVLTLAMLDRPQQPPRRQLAFASSVAEWPALDDAIMDIRDLREVVLTLRNFTENPKRYAAFIPYMRLKLPRVSEERSLRFGHGRAV